MNNGGMTDAHTVRPVVVFTQPHCAPCREVERYLTERGVTFVLRDVLADQEALAILESRGYMGTPVTQIGDQWIAGFRRTEFDRALLVRDADVPPGEPR